MRHLAWGPFSIGLIATFIVAGLGYWAAVSMPNLTLVVVVAIVMSLITAVFGASAVAALLRKGVRS